MEGDPVHRRDDPPDLGAADFGIADPPPRRRPPDLVPATILSAAFGLAAALTAVIRSDILSAPDDGSTWLLSALAIAAIAGCWLAGFIHLLRFLLPDGGRPPRLSQWPAWLAAFAAGPLLVALFFLGAGLAAFPASGVVVFSVAAIVVGVLLFARRNIRLLAERLLVTFFLWLFILVAPTFWRDPVNDQMSSFLFGLLKATGLLT